MREKFTKPFVVSVDDILLDTNNFRYYGQLTSQRECIDAMLNDQKAKIYVLAKDIAENGLTPDPIVLSKGENGYWVAREGNRRITALKLLNKPTIITDKSIRTKFSELSRLHEDKIPATVECIACDDENTILDYLDRVHTGLGNGTGRREWNAENKTYYGMHRGRPAENMLAIKVKEMVVREGATLKEPYNITNLQRVLQNRGVQSILDFSWDGENITTSIDSKVFTDLLKEIAVKVGLIKVGEIYTAKNQQVFVEGIVKNLGIDLDNNKTDPYIFGTKVKGPNKGAHPGRGTIPRKPSWDRKRLIPVHNTYLSIPDVPGNIKAKNIVYELARKIDVRESPNAAAVLMRVLIEFSVEHYISKNGLTGKDNLSGNIRSIANHMHSNGKIKKEYLDEVVRLTEHHNLLSAKSLQRFVHSFDFSPDRQTLCTLWENIDRFVAYCWK